jgi:hypothetical protein
MTPLAGDQPLVRALPNTNRINTDIHALGGIRTHNFGVRAGENISCLKPRGHCDQPTLHRCPNFYFETE